MWNFRSLVFCIFFSIIRVKRAIARGSDKHMDKSATWKFSARAHSYVDESAFEDTGTNFACP